MANSAIEQLIEILDSNLPRSVLFQKNVPVLAEAFHAGSMRQILQDALFGPNHEHYSLENCTPGKALYLPDHMINMQYKLTILDKTNNQTTTTLVNARLFQDVSSCKTYLENTLIPIAAQTNGRPEIKPFANPVAIVEHLKMALSVFPIDGMIPTLVEATDPHKIQRRYRANSSSKMCTSTWHTTGVLRVVSCAILLMACKLRHKPGIL